ncbi:bifunctional ADP-dependent NAD(P)H-hydrate dehydratase/NAD(P)H-hydrate epimerase [Clostridium sp. AT4]|jgi:hydroxyethylthiazole kinase-like uncharacterized protein yjeF|uniref:bifunctional ADP-dependent NAD(P)H-hydrate dehydratase/NAD(P)H-hydrate epimerase n=1 Tax=Clostridium sp. AT4 TaxID=1720194 RepID=UPI000833E7DD|nr:bifunctional ADP-dependent NAD(P)H-hydrate dehydratase/NAD(P)H-hydrate epimerase [Clostridium sp. AT4]
MRTLLTGRKMKAVDHYTIHEVGIPSLVLMERAALAVADCALKAARAFAAHSPVWALCGVGNNGADAAAAARMVYLKGLPAVIFLASSEEKATEELKLQLSIARKLGIPVKKWELMKEEAENCGILFDGLFGVGLSREIQGEYRACMELAAEILKGNGKTKPWCIAVDIPSGIHSGTGAVMGIALKADETVAFGWEKIGTAVYPGRDYAGNVTVADIGFPEEALRAEQEEEDPISMAYACEESDLNRVPERKAYSNKGTFGRVLIAAGSKNMSGAAYLSALGAYRAGAGLVKILTVEENRTVLQTLLPEAIISSYRPEELLGGREDFKERIEAEMNWADVVVLGPGLGSEPYVEYLVEDILTSAFVPVIIDADGLNTIASHPYLTSYYTENIVITPHLGEMARLTSQKISEIQADLPAAAFSYASHYGITCVLKDAAAVTAGKEGTLYINTSGSSAMAKAGSGDVLTGILAGLMALGMEEEEAAALGVYIHGLAGERAAGNKLHSLLASEIAEAAGAFMDRQKEEIKTK